MVMVISVSQHKLIKIRRRNRQKLTRLALYCSLGSFICDVISSSTDSWLYTSEVLKYYVPPNNSQTYDDTQGNDPVFYKNASFGPWQYCWLDPMTEFHCTGVQYLVDDDPSDVTTSVQQSIRRAFLLMICGVVLVGSGLVVSIICNLLPNPYSSLLVCTVVHINAGIANFLCIVVFMSAVSKEVGNKIHPASEMDDPLFHFEYGFSFILLQITFLMTELAALLSIVVYMAKRDERTFNRYKILSLLKFNSALTKEGKTVLQLGRSDQPTTRYVRARRARTFSQRRDTPSLDSIALPLKLPSADNSNSTEKCGSLFLPGFFARAHGVKSANKSTSNEETSFLNSSS